MQLSVTKDFFTADYITVMQSNEWNEGYYFL